MTYIAAWFWITMITPDAGAFNVLAQTCPSTNACRSASINVAYTEVTRPQYRVGEQLFIEGYYYCTKELQQESTGTSRVALFCYKEMYSYIWRIIQCPCMFGCATIAEKKQ